MREAQEVALGVKQDHSPQGASPNVHKASIDAEDRGEAELEKLHEHLFFEKLSWQMAVAVQVVPMCYYW